MPSLSYRKTRPEVHKSAYTAPTVSLIGDVVVGAQSSLWFGVVARGDINLIRIGQRTNIQDGTIIHVSAPGNGTHIGDDVTVGHMAVLHDCTLLDGSFVAIKACVLDGVVVESGAMVAAGALVTPGKVVRSGELWSGVPAKPTRALKAEEVDMIRWIPEHYVELAQEYLKQARFSEPRSNR
jgi:carbonic anhydrase/acetyltransferase-like protein (isoleucine patch superfamily)